LIHYPSVCGGFLGPTGDKECVIDDPTEPLSYVIAVTGSAGSGESTLDRDVAARPGEAVAVFLDDFERVSTFLEDVARWAREGASAAPASGALPQGVGLLRPTNPSA
jgi:hypothetical protein